MKRHDDPDLLDAPVRVKLRRLPDPPLPGQLTPEGLLYAVERRRASRARRRKNRLARRVRREGM